MDGMSFCTSLASFQVWFEYIQSHPGNVSGSFFPLR